jgi:hypothetical protein
MREDGICFAVLTHREGGSVQPVDLEQIIAEFQALQA